MTKQAAWDAWQARLDGDFPNGIIMTWHERADSPVYRIPRAEVLDIVGEWDWPVVSLHVFDVEKSFVVQIAIYDRIREEPALVRVTAFNVSEQMTWDADVAPDLAEAMRAADDEQ